MAADRNKKKHEATASGSDAAGSQPTEEPVVRDRRRIDPDTGEARTASQEDSKNVDETVTDEELAKLLQDAMSDSALDSDSAPRADSASDSEHLADLKRVQAEYANYRKRVDRDRFVARDLAVAEVITGILPILDDLDLAHAHGDLEGTPLEIVAKKIRTLFDRYGLVKVGEVGDPFDPNLHEAIAQLPSKDATVETIADVVLPGYLLGERLLRPAKVAVSVPEE